MSLITFLTKKPPEIAGYTFDAVMEDTVSFSVDLPEYPIESGALVSDHRVINKIKCRIIGLVSEKPLTPSFADFAGGIVSNLSDNPVVATVAGMSAGFLASTDATRPATALDTFVQIMETGKPFDVVRDSLILRNMLIKSITTTKVPQNEGMMEFVMRLEEFVSLDRLDESGQPSHKNMREGTKEQSSCAKDVNKGNVNAKDASSSTQSAVAEVK